MIIYHVYGLFWTCHISFIRPIFFKVLTAVVHVYVSIDYKVQCTSPSVNSLDCRHFWQIIYFLFQIFNYIHVQMTCFILYCYTCMVVNMLVVTTDELIKLINVSRTGVCCMGGLFLLKIWAL